MKSRLISIFLKLARIQGAIDAEHQRRKPDWLRLLRLKRLHLLLKERIAYMSAPRLQPIPVYARRNHHPRLMR